MVSKSIQSSREITGGTAVARLQGRTQLFGPAFEGGAHHLPFLRRPGGFDFSIGSTAEGFSESVPQDFGRWKVVRAEFRIEQTVSRVSRHRYRACQFTDCEVCALVWQDSSFKQPTNHQLSTRVLGLICHATHGTLAVRLFPHTASAYDARARAYVPRLLCGVRIACIRIMTYPSASPGPSFYSARSSVDKTRGIDHGSGFESWTS